jgi:amylovoran biosynthesis glycosyltransferase AmsB
MYKNYTFHSELGVYPSKGLSENLSIGEYLFCHEGRMFTPTLFMHRDVFDNIKFDSRLKRHQDYGFVLRAESLGYKFVFIDEILFHWISDENYEGSKEKNITIDISIDFLAYYGHLMQPVAVKDYLNKIAAPIALKNFSLLRYYKILKAYRIKKHNRFFLFSIVGSLFKTIKAKLGLIF